MRRVQQITLFRARAARLAGVRKHKTAAKVIARLVPLVTQQLKFENRQDRNG